MNEVNKGQELYVHVREATVAGAVGKEPLSWSTDQPGAWQTVPDADGLGCAAIPAQGVFDVPSHLIGRVYEGTADELMVTVDMIAPSGKVTIVDLDDVEVRDVPPEAPTAA
jgi:hypothetical protein